MKKWTRLIFFLLAFQLDVRVRASATESDQPDACLKTKEVCLYQVKDEPLHLKNKNLILHSSEGSVIVRQTQKQWRFVKGILWVENGSKIKIESLYGVMESSQGQYWIIDHGEKILIRNINADLNVTLRDGKKLLVPEGFEFWVSGTNLKGHSEFGMIQPIDMKKHLPLWYSLFTGSKNEFITEVKNLRSSWGDLVEKSSYLYKNLAIREIASVQEKEEKEKLQKKQMAMHLQQVKKIYYQRVFER
ncbi:MAG: hypothetical protein ACXWRG_05245 [Bdellovibrio sp.]